MIGIPPSMMIPRLRERLANTLAVGRASSIQVQDAWVPAESPPVDEEHHDSRRTDMRGPLVFDTDLYRSLILDRDVLHQI